jgi:two-component system, OmpR family, alkaline phosphatase synthesis response regulator PhoP
MTELILLVDDDDSILQLVKMYVEREGFRASVARDGNLAYELIRQDAPALVVLDVMLPGMDGFALCSKLRALGYQVPIIMLTARDEDIDNILGLELGADDYLTKPFNPRELTARIKAILRRRERALVASSPLRIGDLLIDPASREVRCRNAVLDLRTQEFDLLLTLAENKGKVLSREQLL